MPPTENRYDVFLSHSSKDKLVVRELANRLKADGLKVWFDEWEIKAGDVIPHKLNEGLERSRILVLCMSADAYESDWARLESYTFRFRDPLNEDRRFIPLRLDEAAIPGALRQFSWLDWGPEMRDESYGRLREACRPAPAEKEAVQEMEATNDLFVEKVMSLGHTEPIRSVAFSPDGMRAVSGSEDKTVRLWEVATGQCLCVLEGHTDKVMSVAWSSDGKRVLSSSDDKTIRLWDMFTGKCLRVLEGHTDRVTSVAWSSDGRRALSGSSDKTIRLWEMSKGQCMRVLAGHADKVMSVAWGPDDKCALSASSDKTIRLWEVARGHCVRVLEGHTDRVMSVAWSPDGQWAISGAFDKTVRVWEVATGRLRRVLEGHSGRVYSVRWSPDGQFVLSGAADQTMRLWQVETGKCIGVMKGHAEKIRTVAWSPNGDVVLSGAGENTIRLWQVNSRQCLRVLEGHSDRILSVEWSSDGQFALSGAYDNVLRLWEMATGKCLRLMEGHTSSVFSVAWSSDGQFALSGGDDHTLRLWNVRTGKCLRVLEGHTSGVRSVVWSSDGQRVLSGADDNTLRLWEVATGRCLRTFKGHTARILTVGWSSNEQFVLSGADDRTVRLWDIATGRCLRVLEGHTERIWSVECSPDNQFALTGAADNSVRLWQVVTGQCLGVLEGHTGRVYSVAWSSDGNFALSGAADTTVRLWHVPSRQCLGVLGGHTARIHSVAWSSDGLGAFSASNNGVMRFWDLSDVLAKARRMQAADSTVAVPSIANPSGRADSTELQSAAPHPGSYMEQVAYTNAKVLLVGDSGVGKTGLSNRLARDFYKDTESTDGAWATHWPLKHNANADGVEREVWLWDFAGQADYRLVHQLFMDDTAAAVLVFNPQSENPFDGLGHWDRDLQKATRRNFAKLLVGGRIDRGGLMVSSASVEKFMKEREFRAPLHLTSAKTGLGCGELKAAIVAAIDWQNIPTTTSPALYRHMKEEILALRDQGLVLIRLSELKQRMEMSLEGETFDLAQLEAVVSLLAGPGMIQCLDFGGFILLHPEVLSRYAAAALRKVRQHPQELGCILEKHLLAGELDYQDFTRLPRQEETVVLRALLETFVGRAWCLRQPGDGGALLTFPSYFRRNRPSQPDHPSVLVVYRFDGPVDDIYATLVVRLHHTLAFDSTDLWKDAADFKTQTGEKLGFTLKREGEGRHRLEVYFNVAVDDNSRVLFLRYVHEHLMQHAKNVERLRHYVCSNSRCKDQGKAFRDREAIDEALAPNGRGKVHCPNCGKPIHLRDSIEEKFESPSAREDVRLMDMQVQGKLDSDSLELALVGQAISVVAEAGQLYQSYGTSDHGIDGKIEFKDDEGRVTGKRLYLQLKSEDSYLPEQRRRGKEIFSIKEDLWAKYWQSQPYPVMLVVRTSDGVIRWMDVSSYLKRKSTGGKVVKQIVFKGEPFDALRVREMRERVLGMQ